MWDSRKVDTMVKDLSEKKFHAQIDWPTRRYGWFGPEAKGPVADRTLWDEITGSDPEPFSYKKKELDHAVTAIRYINDMEMRMPENISLY